MVECHCIPFTWNGCEFVFVDSRCLCCYLFAIICALTLAPSPIQYGNGLGRIGDENIIGAETMAIAFSSVYAQTFLLCDPYVNKYIYRRQNGHLQFYRKSNLRRQKVHGIPNNALEYCVPFACIRRELCHSMSYEKIENCASMWCFGRRLFCVRTLCRS